MQSRAARFLKVDTFEELARVLRKKPMQLAAIAANPIYDEFYIPKKNGKKRHIENPNPQLKKIQRRLNEYLQAVYFFHRPACAFGFLSAPKNDPEPRNILTNAERHVGCTWMLNVDMKDFFHQISFPSVKELFESPMLGFREEVSMALASICCYKGRLPMGAPTSPIISNIATIPLDQDLSNYAEERRFCYTRYADDLSFSAQEEITQEHFQEIERWVNAYDLVLNQKKIKFFPPDGLPKEVTGLIVGQDKVYLSEEYQTQLRGAISHLSIVVDAQHLTPTGHNQRSLWVGELTQQVRGKLEFARRILGEDTDQFIEYEMAFDEAVEPPEHFGPLSWLDFGYAPIN